MSEKHIGLEIRERVLQYQQKNAIYYKDIELNRWKGISWIELGNQVQQLSKALINFGIEAKQNIGIFAENMPEWIIADISIMSIRAVTIPIYATNSKKEAEYLVNDAEISVIFVGGQNEYDKALQILKTNNFLKLIVALNKNIEIKKDKGSVYISLILLKKRQMKM